MYMDILFKSLAVGIAAYFLYVAVTDYKAAIGTTWQRLLAAGKDSATVLWARFTVVVTGMVTGLVWAADLVNAPSVATAITTYMKPSVVAGIMITVALITELARKRTL